MANLAPLAALSMSFIKPPRDSGVVFVSVKSAEVRAETATPWREILRRERARPQSLRAEEFLCWKNSWVMVDKSAWAEINLEAIWMDSGVVFSFLKELVSV